MKHRLKAFGLHLAGSATVLALVCGTLYLGWYRWPGWYLTGMLHILLLLVGVDVALGPLLTLVVASPGKAHRVLARDIVIIVIVQLTALVYGTMTLWQGRPLYYAFSVDQLQIVQASDLDAVEIELGRKRNPDLTPHWYSRPRWIWAPLPEDPQARADIVAAAISGGKDVIQMPRYFKAWPQGLAELRKHLKKVDEQRYFSKAQRLALKQRMTQLGFATDGAVTIALTGGAQPLLAVFDPGTLQMQAILPAHS
jgi:hypothetical protein